MNNKRIIPLWQVGLLCLGMVSMSHAAELVVNGGFEDPGAQIPEAGMFSTYLGGDSFGGWSVGGESIDVHDTGHTDAHSGQYSLDLAGEHQPGSISQTLSTTSGQQYTLDLWYAGHAFHPYEGPAMAEIYWEGSSIALLVIDASPDYQQMNWTHFQAQLTANSDQTLLELRGVTENGGVIVDDISVSEVPLPASAWLFGSCLLGLAGRLRRASN